MNHDGVKNGYANDPLTLADLLTIPVTRIWEAPDGWNISAIRLQGKIDAALAASVFHFGEIKIPGKTTIFCEQGINEVITLFLIASKSFPLPS